MTCKLEEAVSRGREIQRRMKAIGAKVTPTTQNEFTVSFTFRGKHFQLMGESHGYLSPTFFLDNGYDEVFITLLEPSEKEDIIAATKYVKNILSENIEDSVFCSYNGTWEDICEAITDVSTGIKTHATMSSDDQSFIGYSILSLQIEEDSRFPIFFTLSLNNKGDELYIEGSKIHSNEPMNAIVISWFIDELLHALWKRVEDTSTKEAIKALLETRCYPM